VKKSLLVQYVVAAMFAATPAQAEQGWVMAHPHGFPAIGYAWVPDKQVWVQVTKDMPGDFCVAYVAKHFEGSHNVLCLAGGPPPPEMRPADYGLLPEQQALAKATLDYMTCWDKHAYPVKLPSDEAKKVEYAVAAMDAGDKLCQKQYDALDLLKPGEAKIAQDELQKSYLEVLGRLK
jgi:hypothetical protein